MRSGEGPRLPGVLLLLVGPPGAGKSAFAEALVQEGLTDFEALVSCDAIKAAMFGPDVSDDLADPVVFERMDGLVQQRLSLGLPAVVDATNVTSQARLRMIGWAKKIGNPVWVARFTADLATVLAQNAGRAKVLPADVVTRYAEVMAAQATDEQLISEGVDRIIDVAGLREATAPREAVRLAFPDLILRAGFNREAHQDR